MHPHGKKNIYLYIDIFFYAGGCAGVAFFAYIKKINFYTFSFSLAARKPKIKYLIAVFRVVHARSFAHGVFDMPQIQSRQPTLYALAMASILRISASVVSLFWSSFMVRLRRYVLVEKQII